MDRIELLISRSLDGEIGQEEELELNRELLRNPAARRMLDDARRLDKLAAASIQSAVPYREVPLEAAMRLASGPSRRKTVMPRMHRGWWLVPGAIAAALLAVGVSRESLSVPSGSGPGSAVSGEVGPSETLAVNHGPTVGQVTQSRPLLPGDHLMRNVTSEPQRRVKRDVSREIFGIVVDPSKIFLIEVDRTRVLREPRRTPLSREQM